jgi:hypothetical protein
MLKLRERRMKAMSACWPIAPRQRHPPPGANPRHQRELAQRPFRIAALLRCPVVFMTAVPWRPATPSISILLADFSGVARAERDAALEAAITRYAALVLQYCRGQQLV